MWWDVFGLCGTTSMAINQFQRDAACYGELLVFIAILVVIIFIAVRR